MPSVSVIVPVRNEAEKRSRPCLHSLLSSDPSILTVRDQSVVDGMSEDDSMAIVLKLRAREAVQFDRPQKIPPASCPPE